MKILASLLFTVALQSGYTEQWYKNKLCKLESNCNQYVVNQFGYLGLYQFGHSALQDVGFKDEYGRWVGKMGVRSRKRFLYYRDAQETALKEWNVILDNRLKQCGAHNKIGTEFKKVKLGQFNLRAASHLLGASYVCKFVHG